MASSVASFPRNDFSDRQRDAGFVGRLWPIFRRLSASRLIVAACPGTRGTKATGFVTSGPRAPPATAEAEPALAAAFLGGGVGALAAVAVFFADALSCGRHSGRLLCFGLLRGGLLRSRRLGCLILGRQLRRRRLLGSSLFRHWLRLTVRQPVQRKPHRPRILEHRLADGPASPSIRQRGARSAWPVLPQPRRRAVFAMARRRCARSSTGRSTMRPSTATAAPFEACMAATTRAAQASSAAAGAKAACTVSTC